jgi:hypothetical protein
MSENSAPRKAPGFSKDDLKNLFTYHAPKGDQAERYGKISEAALHFAEVVIDNTPVCADQTVAIRQIALARMLSNATIACNE